jgi:phospholipase C
MDDSEHGLEPQADLRDPQVAERFEWSEPDEYLRRREFLQRTALTAGLAAGLSTVLDADTLIAEAANRQRQVPLPGRRNLPIDTFVVLMMENRTFDHYLGWMPNADGRQAGISYVDRNGRRKSTRHLGNEFQGCGHPDPDHGWDAGRIHYNGGKMDGFLRSPNNDEFAIGYYKPEDLGFIDNAAQAFTTFDRMFCDILGPTFPNREYLWAAESYGLKNNSTPPQVGYNSGFPPNTIFAALDRAGVSNRYFFNDVPAAALWGQHGLSRSGQIEEYYARCAAGTLPAVSFVDPNFGGLIGTGQGVSGDEHPHGDIRTGQAYMADVALAFLDSPQYRRGAFFIVYDEGGGFFDHVRPPRVPDRLNSPKLAEDFGQVGWRIPSALISPYARRGHVSHQVVTPVSILKMISYRFGLPPLNRRLAYSSNIARSFDWVSRPRLDRPALPDPPNVMSQPCPRSSAAAASRPKEHDMMELVRSGYLERIGFQYRPSTPETTFRQPSKTMTARQQAEAAR